jgi:hypothetical protein
MPQTPKGIIGNQEYKYEVHEDWHQLPEDWILGDVAGVAVNSGDDVYAFTRGTHPVVIFDRSGKVKDWWGDGVFSVPHAVYIDSSDFVYLTDDGDHTVRKFTPDGQLLMTLGIPNKPAPFMSNQPFNKCAQVCVSESGEIYVADGYGNACIHKFSPEGKHLLTWGRSGSDPGEFYLPHCVCCKDGKVYVADRENHRIQIFDEDGHYLEQWNNLHRPCALLFSKDIFFVGELGPGFDISYNFPNLGPRISVLDQNGHALARLGKGPGFDFDQFIAPHGLSADSNGDLYVAEVSRTQWQFWPGTPIPDCVRSLRKLVKIK